jgi:hypothetical protein
VLPLLLFMGNKPSCDNQPLTLSCDTTSITVEPGTCVELENPCADHAWVRLDAFRLCDTPEGLFVQTQRQPRARQICADGSVPALMDEPFEFYYATPGEAGVGTLRVTTAAAPLAVTATATPPSIRAGGFSQLEAEVSGGTPPYLFAWSPATGLDATDIANPTATPSVSTQYSVVVSDDNGLIAGASVTVNVGLGASAAASPGTIDPGQSSALSVQVSGGAPPYTFSWSPAIGLSDPSVANPVASPANTTTYTVTVTDSAGTTGIAQATVAVNIVATASATPATINAGGQSQLEVAVAGGAPPYTYSWSPGPTLDDPAAANPVATPIQTTAYSVVVTDAVGAQGRASVTVTVSATGLTACMVLVPLSPISVQADGGCSTGDIVLYRWWSNFLGPGQPPTAETTTPISPVFLYEIPGPHTVRLEVVDATGATSVTTAVFTSQ